MILTLINWSNVTDISFIPGEANTVSGGSFWLAMLYMVFVIILLVMNAFGWETALLVSSFSCLILGILLSLGNLVNWVLVLPFLGIMLFMFFYMTYNKAKT